MTQQYIYSLKNPKGLSLVWTARKPVGGLSGSGLISSVNNEWKVTSSDP